MKIEDEILERIERLRIGRIDYDGQLFVSVYDDPDT
jgi:hypothetical protein